MRVAGDFGSGRAGLGLALVLGAALAACGDDGGADGATDVGVDVKADVAPDTGGDAGKVDAVADAADAPDAGGDEGAAPDVPPEEGAFGAPCSSNGECDSGWCVEGPQGFICTKTCEISCPANFDCKGVSAAGADVVFLCLPRYVQLCTPCATDTQCKGGACLTIDGSGQCGYACEADEDCPEGFGCLDAPGGTHDGQWCQPRSGSCTCTPEFTGAQRSCQQTSELGSCYGVETCDPELGWTGCTAAAPVPELCDGKDNDCNGLVDDGLPQDEACENTVEGVGTCVGVNVCFGPQGWVCQAATPEPETCDFKDNDCDGDVDEGFKTGDVYSAHAHCGTCNASCDSGFPNAAVTSCQVTGSAAQCIVETCQQGFIKLNEFQCVPNVASICQPCTVDANCLGEGAACIPVGTGTFCSKGCATAADCPGGYACEEVGKASPMCVPVTDSCSCDGTNTDLSRACSVTHTPADPGKPAYTCTGFEQCTAEGWAGCELPGESCDGVDNDCDGETDEAFKDAAGKYAGVQHCGGCNISCLALAYPNSAPACDASLPVPQCTFACQPGWFDVNGLIDDGCECQPVAGPDLAGDGQDTNCDGIDGEVAEGVFVAKNGHDDAPGTLEAPMLTISAAVERAFDAGKRDVYVATGVYGENVVLRAGVGVFGGYASDFATRNPLLYETAILGQAPTAAAPGAVTAVGLGAADAPEPTVVDGFTVFGPNAANQAGANSYAMYLRDGGAKLIVRNNRVFAGAGGNGTAGAAGGDGTDGSGGVTGGAAYDAGTRTCTSTHEKAGGAGGKLTCGGVDVAGGDGGAGRCPVYDTDPLAAEVGKDGKGPGAAGKGGAGGVDNTHITQGPNSSCGTCYTNSEKNHNGAFGTAGAKGATGALGQGCAALQGSVVAGHWQGQPGQSGGAGGHGSGGGGGGAGGGVEVVGNGCATGSTDLGGDDIGGQGGGGGSGGCAGTGGAGGSAGGGSFGVFVIFTASPGSLPVLQNNTIRRGAGGAGGTGGPGGAGGLGGDGAPGGASGEGNAQMWCAAGGAAGGDGGQGGHGGGGGGGCGGASYGLFLHQAGGSLNASAYKSANAFLPGGQGGPGGAGGPSLGQSGTPGAAGASADTNF